MKWNHAVGQGAAVLIFVFGAIGALVLGVALVVFGLPTLTCCGCCGAGGFEYAGGQTVHGNVTGHAWRRAIDVQERQVVRKSDWCDDLPRDAVEVERTTRRHYENDGSHMDDWCTYTREEWVVVRTEELGDTTITPAWPEVPDDQCEELGCLRPGDREQTYTLDLQWSTTDMDGCDVDETQWSHTKVGDPFSVRLGGMTGNPVCTTLVTGLAAQAPTGSPPPSP